MKIGIHKYLFILYVYITLENVCAQSYFTAEAVTAPDAIYTEFLGQSYLFSVNYDRMLFNTTPHNIALRAGLGVWANISFSSTDNESGVVIPLNVSYVYGSNHKFELGLGFTIAPNVTLHDGTNHVHDFTITGIIGYRYQPIDGGFLFRGGMVPVLGDEGIIESFGLSFGLAF